jgi:4-alpha-glucanotransferase
MLADGFRFWLDRVRTQMRLFDMIRIDHFRGFESYWEIPGEEQYAVNGRWVKALGDELFERLHQRFGRLPLIAEDLGLITPAVDALRKKYRLPGMKVLHFAFSGESANPYLPFRHDRDSLVYTGTHDNDTTLGWYDSLDEYTRGYVDEYLGVSQEPMPWPLIRCALASRSHLAILPMQDILGLDSGHRMNVPGTTEGNWGWRFSWDQVHPDLPARLCRIIKLYGR